MLRLTGAGLAAFALFSSTLAIAKPAVFGPEFTFTNKSIRNAGRSSGDTRNPIAESTLQELIPDFKSQCLASNCIVTEVRDHNGYTAYRATYSDGFWFQLSTDPGTLEVQAKPLTLVEWEQHAKLVQHDLFDFMANHDLKPSDYTGGGHVNVGMDAFENDAKWFRDFFVDYTNNPGLAMGIWDDDFYNAPPLYAVLERRAEVHGIPLKDEVRNFENVIADFDRLESPSYKAFVDLVLSRIYIDQPFHADCTHVQRYQSINLAHVIKKSKPDEARVEMRSHRAQKDMDEFLTQIRTYQNRIDYLRIHPGVKVDLNFKSQTEAIRRSERYGIGKKITTLKDRALGILKCLRNFYAVFDRGI